MFKNFKRVEFDPFKHKVCHSEGISQSAGFKPIEIERLENEISTEKVT